LEEYPHAAFWRIFFCAIFFEIEEVEVGHMRKICRDKVKTNDLEGDLKGQPQEIQTGGW
jgi:hypothetical protein